MAIRMLNTEHLVAVGFGAGEALVAGKVTGVGPGGIPWTVLYEGAGLAAGFLGDKVGIPAAVRDTLLVSSLALAGARMTRAALQGKLAAGPKAWGGDAHGGDYFADPGAASGGGPAAQLTGRNIRYLGTGARGGGWSVSGGQVPFAEPAGVMG